MIPDTGGELAIFHKNGANHMNDFGDALHWTDTIRGWASLGIYGWSDQGAFQGLSNSIDFQELEPTT